MKALTLAEIDRALARERNQRKKKPTKAASHHKAGRRKTTHHKADHHKAGRRKTAHHKAGHHKVSHRTAAHHETRHRKITKKAHHTGPLRGAAKAEFLARMKRGRERARRARARQG